MITLLGSRGHIRKSKRLLTKKVDYINKATKQTYAIISIALCMGWLEPESLHTSHTTPYASIGASKIYHFSRIGFGLGQRHLVLLAKNSISSQPYDTT